MTSIVRPRLSSLAVAVLLSLTACTGSFGERAREEVHQSVDAGDAPAVRIDNIAGSVRVDGWAKPNVNVHATKYGADTSELHDITIAVRREGNGVSIATNYTGTRRRGGVRYRISVPANASLRIGNVAGAVDIAGVHGDVSVQTQAGEVSADVGRVAAGRSIDLQATTGAITLSIARDSNANVEASSTVGDFTSDVPGLASRRENFVGARADGTIGSGGGKIRLSTTTGAIALRERS
jgi:hypothetical protein